MIKEDGSQFFNERLGTKYASTMQVVLTSAAPGKGVARTMAYEPSPCAPALGDEPITKRGAWHNAGLLFLLGTRPMGTISPLQPLKVQRVPESIFPPPTRVPPCLF